MEYKADELLETLFQSIEEPNILQQEFFADSLYFFSSRPKDFHSSFKRFKNSEVRCEIFAILFSFLPITKNIIRFIAVERKFFSDTPPFEEGEERILEKGYFSETDSYYSYLSKVDLDPTPLEKKLKEKERELKDRKGEYQRLLSKRKNYEAEEKKKSELLNTLKNEGLIKDISAKLDKVQEQTQRFNNKLKALGGNNG